MKKHLIILLLVLGVIASFLSYEKSTYHKVFKIDSPTNIYIDLNKNLIFDESLPIKLNDIYYVERNNDFSKDKILKDLKKEEIIFLDYYAKYHANLLLQNRFVKLSNNTIIINKKDYKDLLLSTGFFYENNDISKQKLLDKMKNYHLENYFLVNTKSKKYHKLSCEEGYKSKKYKIIKRQFLLKNSIPCRNCILNEKTSNKILQNTKLSKITNIKKELNLQDISIFFLDLNKNFLPTRTCTTNACKVLKEEIRNTKKSIDFAIYGINGQPEIYNELVNAYKRGIKIRWVCDYEKYRNNHYKDTIKLQNDIPNFNTDKEYDLRNRSAIMHNKFFIFDETKVFTGSTNISTTGITDFNANLAIMINNKDVAKTFKQEFEQMYYGKFHTEKVNYKKKTIELNNKTTIKILFSPQHKIITREIIPIINNAKKYIYIPIFFITNKSIKEALIDAHKRGLDIKIINDATNANSKYTIHKELRKNGIEVKTENYAGKMHIKALIIDDEISILGSMNLSNNGEKRNDENVLIINNKELAEYLKNIFTYLWDKIPNKYLKYDPKAESKESIGSCYDKIDNDYDKKIDKEDQSCYRL